jgi:hypothetical protein
MTQDDLEAERINIARAQLRLEQRKERNASVRFFLGVVLLGIVTLSVNSVITSERSRRELVAAERQLVIPYFVGIENLAYADQKRRIGLFQRASLTPEMQRFLAVLLTGVEEQHRAELAKQREEAALKAKESREKARLKRLDTLAAEKKQLEINISIIQGYSGFVAKYRDPMLASARAKMQQIEAEMKALKAPS